MSSPPRKRFWKTARVQPVDDGFGILLDTRVLQTPAKAPLVVPGRALAEAIAAEWDALGELIRPDDLPLTLAANSTVDRVSLAQDAVAQAIAQYGETDLLCYRTEGPPELRARQAAAWDPILRWSAETLAAPLTTVDGLIHRQQPHDSLAALHGAVIAHSPFALTALHDLVTLSGSLVLGLAVSRRALAAADAWPLSRIDEDWQAEQWGYDAEAAAVEKLKRRDFLRAERLLGLLAQGDESSNPAPL